jgi:hypothetical protein
VIFKHLSTEFVEGSVTDRSGPFGVDPKFSGCLQEVCLSEEHPLDDVPVVAGEFVDKFPQPVRPERGFR